MYQLKTIISLADLHQRFLSATTTECNRLAENELEPDARTMDQYLHEVTVTLGWYEHVKIYFGTEFSGGMYYLTTNLAFAGVLKMDMNAFIVCVHQFGGVSVMVWGKFRFTIEPLVFIHGYLTGQCYGDEILTSVVFPFLSDNCGATTLQVATRQYQVPHSTYVQWLASAECSGASLVWPALLPLLIFFLHCHWPRHNA